MTVQHRAAILMMVMLSALLTLMYPAPVHAATRDQTYKLVVNSTPYYLSAKQRLVMLFIFKNGEKGKIVFELGFDDAIPASTSTRVNYAAGYSCWTPWLKQTWTNVFGGILASYTLYAPFCYNDSHVYWNGSPYQRTSSGYGWGLANSNTTGPDYDTNHTMGTDWGYFRFNGPFGFGCVSGLNKITFDRSGKATYYDNQSSQYNC